MIFNSLEFMVFLPLVFAFYWGLAKSSRIQNVVLLLASYIFYAWWDWRLLSLLIVSSVADFYVGKKIAESRKYGNDKQWLYVSLGINLGLLIVFKYFNFFVLSFKAAFATLGIDLDIHTLNIILPLGISFYTFQTLSYSIDIYRKRLEPVQDWVKFFAFVAFFPQLIAGPIERATRMLPIFDRKRSFDYQEARDGMRYILYGFFKKVVVADNCGIYANDIFDNYQAYGGSDLFMGAGVFFAIQLYADFSAYCEIAIGLGKLFGISLSRNFNYPYFSKSLEEFWQRWHITLNVWFRDYVFVSMRRSFMRNWSFGVLVLINFTLIGLWHGDNWTFVFWGFINGVYFLTYQRLKKKNLVAAYQGISKVRHLPQIAITLFLLILTLVIFRSPSVGFAIDYFAHMAQPSLLTFPSTARHIFWPAFLMVWEWQFQKHEHGLVLDHWKPWQRRTIYMLFAILIMYHFGAEKEFLYFQF